MAKSLFKKTGLLICLSVYFTALCYGQEPPQTLFDRANEDLQSHNFQQAVSLYKKLEHQNTVSGPLFLNMAISYQRMDSLGKAKYYFLKASRFEETQQQASKALEFIETQFSRQSAVLPKLPWDRATDWLQHHIGVPALMAIGIFLLNISAFTFIAHWFTSMPSQYLRSTALILFGITALVIATGFYTRYIENRYSTAVMVTEKTEVTESPLPEASLVGNAFEGYTFTVDHYESNSHPGWMYVRMSNGLYGWIPRSDIMIL